MTMSLLWLLLFLQSGNDSKTVFVDRVAIKVNDKIITEREVFHSYRQVRAELIAQYSGAELDRKLKEAWKDTVSSLEERLLLYEKASELGISVSEDDSRARLLSIKESQGLSDEEFEAILLEQTGMTLEEYVDFRKREDSSQMVIQSQVLSKIKIEDSEIAKYYQENIDKFMLPATYRIAELVFLKSEDQEQSARQKLQECLAFLENGGDFAEAAKQYSDSMSRESGGDLGLVEYGDLNESIEEKVNAMEVGEISEPFETPVAIFVIKLLERNPAVPKKQEDVSEEILLALRSPRMEEEINNYLEELREVYLVQVIVKETPWYLE
jgi:parvulin-like peptidyl-prolyl isomerase